MRKLLLLLTATIDVRDVAFIERRNPEHRKRDYELALLQWCAQPQIRQIVFCENSGFDLRKLRIPSEAKDKDLELLGYDEPVFAGALGKGRGELSTIAHVLEHSRFIDPDTLVVKVTGRYYVPNCRAFFAFAQRCTDIDVICNLTRGLTYADTRIFAGSIQFLRRYLCPLIGYADDTNGVFIEHLLARATHRAIAEGLRWQMPPSEPDILGVSGTSGYSYDRRLPQRLVRSALYRAKRHLIMAHGP